MVPFWAMAAIGIVVSIGGAAVAASSAARNTSLPCIRVYCQ